jgi:hypothetical protein
MVWEVIVGSTLIPKDEQKGPIEKEVIAYFLRIPVDIAKGELKYLISAKTRFLNKIDSLNIIAPCIQMMIFIETLKDCQNGFVYC